MTNVSAPIKIVPYDPIWPQQFEELREVLAEKLRALTLGIEHVGSTAVPGLPAKPILDVDIVIATQKDLAPAVAALQELGYEHQGDLGIPGREAFRYSGRDVPRNGSGREWPRHHLYACVEGNRELRRHLAFRDYLRQHPEEIATYSALKYKLAEEFAMDRHAYAEAKSEFVVTILGRVDPSLA
jgi:GrpB-like predicted nucleotidyltransferase (UPF0157 family)